MSSSKRTLVPSFQPISNLPEQRKGAKGRQQKPILKKKKTRRGGRGKSKKKPIFELCDSWKIFQSNIRGFDFKVVSLKSILNNIQPNVAVLNEINMKGNRKLKMEGFTSYNRNRQFANMGGVATCIDNKEASNVLKVAEGADDDEYVITRHGQFRTPINIVYVYGEIESRSTKI